MNEVTPYEYYNDKLGVKVRFLISDKNKAEESLCLISYRAMRKRMDVATGQEKQLRRASLGCDALVEFKSLSQEWQDMLTTYIRQPTREDKREFFCSTLLH